jgi:hypothetical protein
VSHHLHWRLPYKFNSIATFSNLFLDQTKTKTQQTQKQTPLWQGNKKPIVSNHTGTQTTMSFNCGYFSSNNSSTKSLAQLHLNNSSTGSVAQPTLNSGPCRTVAIATLASPSAQQATLCHATETLQRSNLGRPSSAAAHAACVRAGALQQSRPVAISRKPRGPSQSARARAVSRHQTAANDAAL